MLVGRRSFCFEFARTGSGERLSCSISSLGRVFGGSCSGTYGETGNGVVRAAGERGAGLSGASGVLSTASRRACMLEKRFGNWKLKCAVSVEPNGMRLDIRLGRSSRGIGGEITIGDLGGISTTEGLTCCTILNEDSVGVKTTGRLRGEGVSSTGDRGRTTWRAAGGAFLVPLRIESRGRCGVDVVVTIVGIGGVSGTRILDDRFGVLKLGAGEWLRCGRDGTPPKVEWR